MKKPTLIAITGPTASGKSALAISLAKRIDTEIINADSRQIYKGIPISTATPTEEEKEGVRHHLLEFLELDKYYSASKFQEDAMGILENIFSSHDTAIVCGGSMLYTDSLIYGIDDLPTVPQDIRDSLTLEWKEKGDQWLLQKLKLIDPVYYYKVDLRNLKRVFHAIEISLTAGLPYSSFLTGKRKSIQLPFNVVKVFLNGPREMLFDRINNRVIKMVETGLENEARNVYHLRHLNSLNTVGLKEMFAYLDGTFTFEEAIARIQKNTRVYAKKQITWHKRDDKMLQLDFSDTMSLNVEKITDILTSPR